MYVCVCSSVYCYIHICVYMQCYSRDKYVAMYLHMHIQYVCIVYVCTCVRTYVCMYLLVIHTVCLYVHTYVHTCVHLCVCTYCIWTCVSMCVCVHARVRTYIITYTHLVPAVKTHYVWCNHWKAVVRLIEKLCVCKWTALAQYLVTNWILKWS